MTKADKIKRAIAFYCAVTVFCILLPIVLSYSLGYKIDYHNLKIYKTGILYLQSRPAGASIYLDGKMIADLTPAQIEELKPGTYRVEVRREGFYPWEREMVVRPNMVTRADRIVLFPVAQEMKKVGERGVTDFVISGKGAIYYMKRSGLYKSAMDGSSMKRLSSYASWPDRILGKKFSPAGEKLLYFTDRDVWVVYLEEDKISGEDREISRIEEAFKSRDTILDAFWYPGAGYIMIVTEKDIEVVELHSGGARNIVPLYKFSSRPQGLFYDEANSSLYFTDTGTGSDPKESRYLYRIDLKQKFFDQILKMLLKKEPDDGYEKK